MRLVRQPHRVVEPHKEVTPLSSIQAAVEKAF
jgi:hypothetical protein